MPRTDIELWERTGQGDQSAFALLFRRYADPIYNFCFRRTADWALAEDLTSRTFLEAWRRRADAKPFGESVLPWLYGVAANVVRAELRSKRRGRVAYARLQVVTATSDTGDEVAERVESEERMRHILTAMTGMSDIDRDVLILRWQELSYAEIALALDLPVGTVRSRLSRTRARLRAEIAKAREPADCNTHLSTAIGGTDGQA